MVVKQGLSVLTFFKTGHRNLNRFGYFVEGQRQFVQFFRRLFKREHDVVLGAVAGHFLQGLKQTHNLKGNFLCKQFQTIGHKNKEN